MARFCQVVGNSPELQFLDLGEEVQGGNNLRTVGKGRFFGVDDGATPVISFPTLLPIGDGTNVTSAAVAYVRSFASFFMHFNF